MAVIASTLTTVAVFFPLVFVQGVAGQLFRDQALTVAFAMLISLVVAMTLIPMLGLAARPLAARVSTKSLSRPRWHRRRSRAVLRVTRRVFRAIARRVLPGSLLRASAWVVAVSSRSSAS